MALRILKSIADQPLPVTITDPLEVAAVKRLSDSECVKATFTKDALGAEMAVIHSITAFGRTAMKAWQEDPR